jgi:hypothetical protein
VKPVKDPVARNIALAALALALVAAVLAGYAVSLGTQYLQDVRELGDAIEGRGHPLPLDGPPPSLDTGEP